MIVLTSTAKKKKDVLDLINSSLKDFELSYSSFNAILTISQASNFETELLKQSLLNEPNLCYATEVEIVRIATIIQANFKAPDGLADKADNDQGMDRVGNSGNLDDKGILDDVRGLNIVTGSNLLTAEWERARRIFLGEVSRILRFLPEHASDVQFRINHQPTKHINDARMVSKIHYADLAETTANPSTFHQQMKKSLAAYRFYDCPNSHLQRAWHSSRDNLDAFNSLLSQFIKGDFIRINDPSKYNFYRLIRMGEISIIVSYTGTDSGMMRITDSIKMNYEEIRFENGKFSKTSGNLSIVNSSHIENLTKWRREPFDDYVLITLDERLTFRQVLEITTENYSNSR